MDNFSGRDLLKSFADLKINTGNITEPTFNAWFDTDCEATKELLQWICLHLHKDNILSPLEQEECERVIENNLLLSGKPYDIALSQIKSDFPEILDYESNKFEIECLEDELTMLQDEERQLEHLLNVNEELNRKLTKQTHNVTEEDIATAIEMDTAQEKCIELSCKLDELHEKLHLQVHHYSKHLQEFEHAPKPVFISNIPTVIYDQYNMDITSYIGLFLKKQEFIPKSETVIHSVKKIHQDSSYTIEKISEQFDVLQKRIFKSCQQFLFLQMWERKLQAEIKFLKNLNIQEIVTTTFVDDSTSFMLEASIFSKKELLGQVLIEIENMAQQVSNETIYKPKINLFEHSMMMKNKKLEILNQIHLKTTEIFARNYLLSLLLEKEKNDIQSTDKFFRDVHYYIVNNLHNCLLQRKGMEDIINHYEHFSKLHLKEQVKLVDVINNLLYIHDDDSSTPGTVLEKLKAVDGNVYAMEQQVFFNDYTDYRQSILKLEQEKDFKQQFLTNGPTTRIVSIPHQVLQLFHAAEKLLKNQETALNSAISVNNEAKNKLSVSKWFRMRRQLWMWFLVDPHQLHIAQEQIRNAVKDLRNQTVI